MRIIAKVGALAQMRHLGSTAANAASDVVRRVPKEQRGNRSFVVRNYEMEGAFGAPGDAANIHKVLVSARSSFDALVGQDEKRILDELRTQSGEWRTVPPDDPGHGVAWEKAVNLQIGQDAMGRKFLEGATVDEVVDWLRRDPAGMAYARRNAVRRNFLDEWAERAGDQVEAYLPTPELKALALGRKAKAEDLARVLPDAASRPIVQGELLADALGGGVIGRTFDMLVQRSFDVLGRLPTDILSRQPFFDHMYQAEARRLVELLDDQGVRLSAEMLRDVEAKARTYALGETRHWLYDLAERSEGAELLRFWAPFYSAWQEVLSRWSGLAAENPAFVARVRQAWLAPERAGLIYDENGNRVDENGQAVSPTGERVKAGAERFIRMRIPEWASDVPGFDGLESQGSVYFDKTGFNMVLQGYPGAGPIVQIPVNEIVKDRPDMEKSLSFVLPYGSTQEVRDLLLPAAWKRLQTRTRGEEDRAYANTLARIYQTKLVDWNLGKRDDRPTWEEAKSEADAFFSLRVVASATLPVAPSFRSPYQLYIDAYRQLREQDPQTADERFLDTYGPEFFPLTQSLSRSLDGIPPTLEGHAARQRYRDLVEEAPELGALIVGAEGAGEFASSVYAAQFAERLRPGSNRRQRETPSFEEFASAPSVRIGWIEFGRAMDLIDAERIQRGLPNLQVRAARDLATLKGAFIDALAVKYPEWHAEFSTTDRLQTTRRIAAMRKVAADERLAGRDDIRGLADYLRARDAVAAELARRRTKSLTARDNRDLAFLWETIVGKLVEQNLAFAALHHRWLEHDVPEAA